MNDASMGDAGRAHEELMAAGWKRTASGRYAHPEHSGIGGGRARLLTQIEAIKRQRGLARPVRQILPRGGVLGTDITLVPAGELTNEQRRMQLGAMLMLGELFRVELLRDIGRDANETRNDRTPQRND